MSDWTARLQKLQAAAPAEEVENIDHLTLEMLKMEKMTFGKSHLGRPFIEVWNTSPEWTKWFLQHYQSSNKLAHRKMIRFIQMMIEETETQGGVSQQTPINPATHTSPKTMIGRPKAKSMPAPSTSSEISPETVGTPWMEQDPHNLHVRMLNLEKALHQILEHLAPTPVENFPVMPIKEEWNDPWNN